MSLLEVKNIKKVYATRFGGNQVTAIDNISFSIEEGEYVAIMGESGSGKTTLLNMLATLDMPTAGEILLDGTATKDIRQKQLSAFRRDYLGFIFQDFNLLDTFSLKDNILLPLVLQGKKYDEMQKRLVPLVNKLGIADMIEKYPYEVSGGQKQRAAAARALITNPRLLLADEPTGALDSKAARNLLHILSDVNQEGQTILMVTHSIQAAKYAGRVLFIKDGSLFYQIYRGNADDSEMYHKIADALSVLQAKGGMSNEP